MYAFRYLVLPAVVLLCAVSVTAEDFVLGQMYGSGVHAYFSAANTRDAAQTQQQYLKAHEYLTSAIDGGTNDPRAYYFRGLAYIKLGRPAEAELDFKNGAELESGDLNRLYNVARSLQRIQGHERLALENYRVKARMAALKEAERIRRVRYEQIRVEESRVLDDQAAEAPEAPADVATPPADADPFEVGPKDRSPLVPAVEEPAAEPIEKPVAIPIEKPTAGPAEPPAFEGPAEPAVQPPGAKQPGGVLGAMGRALRKAVGGEDKGTVKPAVPVDIPGPPQEAAPVDDDPFAEEGPVPPGKKPAPAKEAAPVDDDPFAEDVPVAPAKKAAPPKKTVPPKKAAPPEKAAPADDDPFALDEPAPAPKQPKKMADPGDPFSD